MKKLLTFLMITVMFCSFSFGQRTITGTVTDDSGLALIGANILIKGTVTGAITDIDGNFTIEVPDGSNILVFSYTGYTTKEVDVTDVSTLDIILEEGQLLDEIVVTGYGTQTKKQITGSVTSVKSEDVEKIQNSNVIQGLSGKVSGVQIIQQSGQPGEGPSVRFRGIGSINAQNDPLYVVDGIVFNGNINSIASQDIESINFLKDASANALYGSRGANGVIVITTKKGIKNEGIEITLDTKIGYNTRATPEYDIISDPSEFYETYYDRIRIGLIQNPNNPLSPEEAAQMASSTLISGGEFSLGYNNFNVADDQVIDPKTGKVNPSAQLLYNDNWQEELFSNSFRNESYLSVSSNTGNARTRLSLGYLDDAGYALESGFERISSRLSLDYDVNNYISIGGNINYAHTTQEAPIQNVGSSTYSNLFSWARNVAPIYPVYAYDENGDRIFNANGDAVYDFGEANDDIPGVRPYGAFNNPVATSILDEDRNKDSNFSGRGFLSVNFLNDFNFTYNFSLDNVDRNVIAFATPIGGDAKGVNGRLTNRFSNDNTVAHQQLLTWRKEFNKHNITILAGHESNNNNYEWLRGQKTEVLISTVPVLDGAASIQYLEGYKEEYTVEGFLSRLNYDYSDKIFLNASLRRDGSSVFHPDNRWGTFYGVGVAYDLHKDLDTGLFSNLRLKASYGTQGNDALLYEQFNRRNYFAYLNQFNVVNAGGGVPGVTFLQLGNEDLVWETSKNSNIGLDLAIFDNRLRFTGEYFIRKVEDLLFYNPLPVSEGRGSFPDNVGDMENKGIELELGLDILRSDDFNFGLSFNVTHFENEITRLPQEFIDDGRFRLEAGRSRYDYFMREFAGVDPENGDGTWYIDELDDDGNVTGRTTTNEWSEATEYFVGKSAIPDFYGGLSMFLGYKNLELTIGTAFQKGGFGYDGLYQSLLPSAGDVGHNYHRDVNNTWTPENKNAPLPRIDVLDDDQSNTSDLYLIPLDYFSLQDVYFGYTISPSLLKNIGIQSAKLYLSTNNLKLWSKRDGYDPRLSITGNATNEYSILRRTTFGAIITF